MTAEARRRPGIGFVLGLALGRFVLFLLMKSVRFRVEHEDRLARYRARGEPVILAAWHGRLLPSSYHHRRHGLTALISQSRDGEYIARVVEGWGYRTVRGSSSRGGGDALRRLVREARAGRSLAITPDGPRGPRQRLQPGVITAAQLTGLPIIPVAVGCRRAWWPGSWDRFCVPKPFARVVIRYGEPREVARDATDEELREHARALEAEMNSMIEELDRDGGPDR